MNKIFANIITIASLACAVVGCDADDPSLVYQEENFAVGQVSLSTGLNQQQREAIGTLLDNMVKVEPCQFLMGAQSRLTSRPNYHSAFSSNADSLKLTGVRDANGVFSYTKNSAFVDYVHLLDKRTYRHSEDGKVFVDTVYYTQVYKMPKTTGSDNGNLWVGPVTEMCIPNEYYIGKFEVTQAQWMAVMGEWPTGRRCIEVTANDGRDSAWYAAVGRGDDYPAYNVWYADAVKFCQRLNELCNMPDAQGRSFRLPTEAEWECAARGARYSRGYRFPGSDTYSDVAWCSTNAFSPALGSKNFGMHKGGKLAPNELGIYDMAGNVSEWVQNTYYRYTYRDSIADASFNQKHLPLHAENGFVGDTLILRGGSWYQNSASSFASSSRQEYTRGSLDQENLQSVIMHCGFRVVLSK